MPVCIVEENCPSSDDDLSPYIETTCIDDAYRVPVISKRTGNVQVEAIGRNVVEKQLKEFIDVCHSCQMLKQN